MSGRRPRLVLFSLVLLLAAPVARTVLAQKGDVHDHAIEEDRGGTGEAVEYTIDTGNTQIVVGAEHFGLVDMSAILYDCRGTIWFDALDLEHSSVDVEIRVDSLQTGNPERRAVALSGDFLDAANHPLITVKSKSISKPQGKAYLLLADVTVRGVTKEIRLPLRVTGPTKDPFGNQRLGLYSQYSFDRRDFGMDSEQAMPYGEPQVGYAVRLAINVEATRPM